MKNPTRKAKVKATGQIIEVYRLTAGGWCNYADCKTTYQDHEIEFI